MQMSVYSFIKMSVKMSRNGYTVYTINYRNVKVRHQIDYSKSREENRLICFQKYLDKAKNLDSAYNDTNNWMESSNWDANEFIYVFVG